MSGDRDKKPTPESVAGKVARALLKAPALKKKPRKRRTNGNLSTGR